MPNKIFELSAGIVINVIIIAVLFKMTDIFIGKLKEKFNQNENTAPISQIIPIFQKIINLHSLRIQSLRRWLPKLIYRRL